MCVGKIEMELEISGGKVERIVMHVMKLCWYVGADRSCTLTYYHNLLFATFLFDWDHTCHMTCNLNVNPPKRVKVIFLYFLFFLFFFPFHLSFLSFHISSFLVLLISFQNKVESTFVLHLFL